MGERKKPDPSEAAEGGGFDMTPMIDVTFLLIIFFMCVTEMSDASKSKLELPRIVNGEPDDEVIPGRLTINIKKDGTVEINLRKYTPEQLNKVLKAHYIMSMKSGEKFSNKAIFLRVDKGTKYEDVQKVMQQCMENRLWKLAFTALGPEAN